MKINIKGAIKAYILPLSKDLEDHIVMGYDPEYIEKANDLHSLNLNGESSSLYYPSI